MKLLKPSVEEESLLIMSLCLMDWMEVVRLSLSKSHLSFGHIGEGMSAMIFEGQKELIERVVMLTFSFDSCVKLLYFI